MEKSTKSNQSVERTFQIIEAMGEARRPVRLSELAQKTGLSASTVLRMVHTLVDLGYAFQDQETLQYGLTLQFARIGSLASNGIGLRDFAHPVMEALAQECHEACCLAIEQQDEVVYKMCIRDRSTATPLPCRPVPANESEARYADSAPCAQNNSPLLVADRQGA